MVAQWLKTLDGLHRATKSHPMSKLENWHNDDCPGADEGHPDGIELYRDYVCPKCGKVWLGKRP